MSEPAGGGRQDEPRSPYPAYRRLQIEAPVQRAPSGAWVVSRYSDVVAGLRDPRLTADLAARGASPQPELETDPRPPDHAVFRSLSSQAFSGRVVERLRPWVGRLVDELLDDAMGGGALDVVSGLARPLAVAVVCELLGVPLQDRDRFTSWADDMVAMMEPLVPRQLAERAFASRITLQDYLRELIAERRRLPTGDLLSDLASRRHPAQLQEPQLVFVCVLLLVAGYETAVHAISNAVLALLQHPDQLTLLRSRPEQMRTAVEELLRYESPIQLTGRTALEEIEIGGTTIATGEEVLLLLGAANRDPDAFSQPEHLDLVRAGNHHLAFGGGNHFCPGAPVGRLEVQVALERLIRRAPEMTLATGPLEWREGITFRGVRSLLIEL